MNPMQCRMARAALEWSMQDLASKAEVGVNTVNRFETGQDARLSNMEKMRSALEAAGIIFVPGNGEGPGVRIRKSAETAGELTKQIDAIHEQLAQTDHDAPVSPAKGMRQLEDAHKADKAVKLKNKRAKLKDE